MKSTILLRLFLITCFAIIGIQSYAQYDNHMILKKGYKSKHHYLIGDSIRFLRNHMDVPVIGQIEAIGEDFFVIKAQVFPISEITSIYYYRKSFNFRGAGKMLQFAGPGFLGITAFNALYNSIRPIWSVTNLVTSGSLFLSGMILPLFQVRKYEIGNKFFLLIVPSDPELYKLMNGS
ncbi:MAG: hypothetical protein U9N86_07580 [Bacteroidota bacterium]|nr:hypothetical protein [Bacteroidota bacterium]